MKNKLHIYIIVLLIGLLLVGTTATVWAQDCGSFTLNAAQKKYDLGLFYDAIEIIEACMTDGFTSDEKVEAYKIETLCYLATDSIDKAYNSADRIIQIKPSFEPNYFDPPKFISMIDILKRLGYSQQVVSVSKKAENSYEAPATVIVLTADEIKNRGYTDLDAFFSDLPGFDVSRTKGATYSNIYQRGYRSRNTDRTLFLVDGVEENDLWSNIAYWGVQYPVSMVKRVEIIYGPASTMYGANALAGVINVITKDPGDYLNNSPIGVSADAGLGSYNTWYTDVTVAGRFKNLSISTTFRKYTSTDRDLSSFDEYNFSPDDYNSVDYYALLSVTDNPADFVNSNNISPDNPYYSIETNQSGDTIKASLTDLGAQAAREYDKSAINETVNGSPVHYSNLIDNYYSYTKLSIGNFSAGVQWWKAKNGSTNYFTDNLQCGSDNELFWIPEQLVFYTSYEKDLSDHVQISNLGQYRVTKVGEGSSYIWLTNYANGGLTPSSLVDSVSPYWTTRLDYVINRQFRNELKITYTADAFNMVAGLEYRNTILQGYYQSLFYGDLSEYNTNIVESGVSSESASPGGNYYTVNDIGIYAQGTYKAWRKVFFTLGGRYDYDKIRVTGGYGFQFNPRIAIVAIPGKFVLKAIYSEAFQNASNWTKFSTSDIRQLNNPTLLPEEVTNIEFSVGYHPSKALFADVQFYRSVYNGVVGTALVAYEGGFTQQHQAIGALQISGVQANVRYQFEKLDVYANYTFCNPLNNKIEDGVLTGEYQRVGDIASHHANIGANILLFDCVNVNTRVNYIGTRPVGEGTSVATNPGDFPAVALLNATVTWQNPIKGVDIQLRCNNIFNTEYSDPGVRSADGTLYSYRTPQLKRNFLIRILYDFN